MRITVIGAGIIGASAAWHLAERGADVTVFEAGLPGQGASGRSFGWLNASFFHDEAHFHLRQAGMAAWHDLTGALGLAAARWPGCLWWEEQGAGLRAHAARLRALGYPVEEIDAAEFARREPHVTPPAEALAFPVEGAVDLVAAVAAFLAHPRIRVVTGVAVQAVEVASGRVRGVRTAQGMLAADAVLLAAGTETSVLAQGCGVALPMLHRPGLLMRSAAVPPLLRHLLISPGLEFRQVADGSILAPTVASHQSDTTEEITERPDLLADRALARLRALLPGQPVRWAQVTLAERPVPGDGLPVMGAAGPEGLHIAVMHSGATLGALAGRLAAAEILGDAPSPLLCGYRPQRFG
jgi:glycine/D-amino acid oxidase-like deaminating enzyme